MYIFYIAISYNICVLVHNADNATLSERAQLSTSRDKNYRLSDVNLIISYLETFGINAETARIHLFVV